MRIISQDKMTDITYDGAVIYIHAGTDQIYVMAHVPDESFPIGTYDTVKDAVYVMSLIKTRFMCNNKYFYMPEAEEVPVIREQIKGASRNDTD